jgi:uroporphyrinogen-III synthase
MNPFVVWVTRDEEADGPLCTALRARGLAVELEPVLERRVSADPAALVAGLGPDDWLVLTSAFAIEALKGVPAARTPQVAVVGESSRRLAESLGLRVALVAADGHGQTLFDELGARVRRGVVCYPRSSLAQAPATWGQVELRAPVLYETVARDFDRTAAQRCAVAAVASPSAVDALLGIGIPLASIGRTTSAAIRRQGREPAVEAAQPSFERLADGIAAYARQLRA